MSREFAPPRIGFGESRIAVVALSKPKSASRSECWFARRNKESRKFAGRTVGFALTSAQGSA
jgi:hypothetical protein